MKKIILLLTMVLFAATAPGTDAAARDDFGTLIFNHQIAIGMTFGNVVAAWGKPKSVDRSTTSGGITEYWFFDNGAMVVFENGRVRSFHQ
jgi:hypothetical protein